MAAEAPPAGTLVCRLADIADGGGRMFRFGAPEAEFRLLVLRSGDICYGYVNRCPHFGVPLAARDEQLILDAHRSFRCNTHYARFGWQTGHCDFGDCAGETLPRVALKVESGAVMID